MSFNPSTDGVDALTAGNTSFRDGDFRSAVAHYFQAIRQLPQLAGIMGGNISSARRRLRRVRDNRLRVGVCGWELAHNAAGRAYILAKLYEGFADVEIVGCLFPKFGDQVWEPIRRSLLPIRTFTVVEPSRFLDQALDLVIANPYDLVHLSKPRAPNILLGVLYKLVWNARIIVDVDDEELGFIRATEPIDLEDYLKESGGQMPSMEALDGTDWTRLAVGLATQFDGVTVSNPELQKRYGGSIIPHARDERQFRPSPALTRSSRTKYGVPLDKTVILFFGTPRRHKGLHVAAAAVAALNRTDILFVVVGDFDDPSYKNELMAIEGTQFQFIGNQPFDSIPEIAALGDYCILMQRPTSKVAQFQAPAKVTDALAMGQIVLASYVEPLHDLFKAGACVEVTREDVVEQMMALMARKETEQQQRQRARDFFLKHLSFGAVAPKFRQYVEKVAADEPKGSPALDRLLCSPVFPGWMAELPAVWDSEAAVRLLSASAEKRTFSASSLPAELFSRSSDGATYLRVLGRITSAEESDALKQALVATNKQLDTLVPALDLHDDLPLVSVIMPTFNRAQTIAESVSTVVQQSYSNWELLVCDDASTDATEEVIKRFGDNRIIYIRLPKGGAAAARNSGLSRARGQVIAYLDSDNFWHPKYLSAMVAVLHQHGGHSAVYSDYIDFRVNAHGTYSVSSLTRPPFNHEALLEKPFIDLNSFVHRRELYDNFDGFNPRLTRRQDYDLTIKYTWLRDPIHLRCAMTLYQRNDSLTQITKTAMKDRSCVPIINESVRNYFSIGLPLSRKPDVKRITIISWDLCRNHFSKPYALAEALSAQYEVQLVSFRFFKEEIFPPLRGVKPSFETLYLPGGQFPEFFAAISEAADRINGDVIYVVKPRLPSLGLALLVNERKQTPLILEINDLESVVEDPTVDQVVSASKLVAFDATDTRWLNPHADLWSHVMEAIAKELPVLTTHNENLNRHFGEKSVYVRNIKDERVYDPALYDRDEVRAGLGFGPDDRVILFGGLLRKHKGIYELVELIKRLNDPRYKLLFVGSRQTPDQKQLIAEHGFMIKVLPPQDRTAMARINLAADLVILWLNPDVPAGHYQFPYKATDALAMGTPIIVNDIADMGTLARQGYMIEVPFADWDGMSQAVDNLFAHPEELMRLRAAGQRLFKRQFSYAAARSSFALACYRALAHGRKVYPVAQRFSEQFARFRSDVLAKPLAERNNA